MDDQLIRVVGDLACEPGVERGRARFAGAWVDLDQRVTNIYRREAGGWKIVHHHTDLSPGMLKVVERLQAGK
jgi:ketosteroid isomerase-like protein